MKKYGKILAVVMVMAMLMASVMGVSAAPSSTTDVTVSGDSASKYEVADKEDAFKDLAGTDQKAYDNLTKFNEGTIKTEDLIADASDEVKEALKDKTPITKMYDLVQTTTDSVTGKHKVTLTVPTLTDKAEKVVLLHYNNGAWEVVEVDVDGQTITVELDSLGAFGVYAKLKSEGGQGSAGTGGTNSTWMVALAVAIVAVGAVVIASQKKRG